MAGDLTRAAAEELLADLVAIPSVNPSLDSAGGGESAIAAFAVQWLRARGLAAQLEEAAPGRPNVHAAAGAGGRDLCLYAHLDTVDAGAMEIDPFAGAVAGGRLYGRGAYDMKGGLAAVLMAAAALAAGGPHGGRLSVALVADEEYASVGADAYVRVHRPAACILTEPTDGRLVLTHKGFVWLEVATRGRAAHGSRWDLGVSAIGRMAPVVAALEAFDRDVLRARQDPLVGPASLHCAVISGGTGVSTYAAQCRLQVERRLLPGESAHAAAAEIERIVRGAAPDAEVAAYFSRPGLVGGMDAPVSRAVLAAAAAVTGTEPTVEGAAYWTDAAIFAEAGIPAVIFGPTGAGAHGSVEWVEVDSVVAVARILVEAARRFWA